MGEERLELSKKERDRLKVLHEVRRGHLSQVEAAVRMGLSSRQVRRLLRRVETEGDKGLIHGLRGQESNRKFSSEFKKRVMAEVTRRYSDFGPTLAMEHLEQKGLKLSRETLRKWMVESRLWRVRRRRVEAVHTWRPRRSCFGELVMMDSSPYRWLEQRGPQLELIAMIDDATSRLWGRFALADTTEESFLTLEGWLQRWGRPCALYTDKDSIYYPARQPNLEEQLSGKCAQSQFGRALEELGIEWIAAHSPQAKGRVERLFGTLQDRLVKEMRLAGVRTPNKANEFLQESFLPFWDQRFTVEPRRNRDAHRAVTRSYKLESILSFREARTVGNDYTIQWYGKCWAIDRHDVIPGLRKARVQIERRLDGSLWVLFRGRHLGLKLCKESTKATPSGLPPPGVAKKNNKAKDKPRKKYIPPPDHPWRRTFLSGRKPDISTLR